MSDFKRALQSKILDLQGQRDDLEEQMSSIDVRLEVLQELLAEENGSPAAKTPSKRRGRPPKATTPPATHDPVLEEALQMEGTDPEVAARLKARHFQPAPRPPQNFGPGVKAGSKQMVREEKKGAINISIEDENEPVSR